MSDTVDFLFVLFPFVYCPQAQKILHKRAAREISHMVPTQKPDSVLCALVACD